MNIWIDAQLSPEIAEWISSTFQIEAHSARDLGLRHAIDYDIFWAARNANAVVMSKDKDFLNLLERFGPPPQILWITCGNTSNAFLKVLLEKTLKKALELLEQGEQLVEIQDAR
ncbi:MAG: putative nuclease of putative toxin-antitoxin system [Candidatus Latescibacterota bacterium]|jgi:predicted nuclease of predicted toxin-antitoxin system